MVNIGKDGVVELFPTKADGSTFYLDMSLDNPSKDSRFGFDNINKGITVTKKTEAGVTFFETPGSPVSYKSGGNGSTLRIGSYASGGKGNTQTHNWDEHPLFLYNEKDIVNSEITVYVRAHGDLGKHKSCAFKIHGAPPDATRSLFETVFPISATDSVRANWNYAHFPYDPVKGIKQYFKAYWEEGKWVGLKHVHVVAADRKSSHNQLYADVDPFDASGKPNNNFKLMAEWTDNGSPGYKNIPNTWGAMVNKVRLDGYKLFDFTLFSDREIIPDGKIPPPPPPPGEEPLNIVSVEASGYEVPNVPKNVLDDNLGTRWSQLGKGSNIVLDLGKSFDIKEVDIAWFKGDTRSNYFDISIGQDSTNLTSIFNGQSTGTTAIFEGYQLKTLQNGRFFTLVAKDEHYVTPQDTPVENIALTAVDTNLNAKVTMIVIDLPHDGTLSGNLEINLTYTPNKGYVGEDHFTFHAIDDKGLVSNTATISFEIGKTPPPPPPGNVDQFGIKKLVPDAASKRVETTFTLDKKVRHYRSGKPSEPSIEYTNSPSTAITNQEFTYYVKINGFKNVTDTISSKILGGIHSSSNPPLGTCYDVQVDIFGDAKRNLEVERPHPSMHPCHQVPQTQIGEKLVGKWIGIKTVTYLINNGKDRRVQEWIDYPVADITKVPNSWRLLFSVNDTGQLPSGHIITPIGSRSTCRIDGVWNKPVNSNPTVSDVSAPDFAYASVREIEPQTTVMTSSGLSGHEATREEE